MRNVVVLSMTKHLPIVYLTTEVILPVMNTLANIQELARALRT